MRYRYTDENGVIQITDIIPIDIEFETVEPFVEITKTLVPNSISRMNFKIQLLLNGITITDIIDNINSLPDSMLPPLHKQIAIIKLNEASVFERYDPSLLMVAQMMEISEEKLDEIFINGNNNQI